ncbi:MAG: S49 family peptidase [Leptospiraceae bacterium]|nr:S49 family peptidase [Leptospiraceae bacterium]
MLRWILFPLVLPFKLLMFLWFRITLFTVRGNVLFHTLPDKFTSTVQTGLMYRILNKQDMLWFHYLGFLTRIARDRSLEWLVLSFPDMEDLDWSRIEEIRLRLEEIKASGKRLVGHAEKGGLKTLCLLSACHRRYLSPGNSYITALPHSEPYFFGSALKKWGIRVEVHTAGEFKSAGESVSRDNMSPAARANLEELLDARAAGILSGIDAAPFDHVRAPDANEQTSGRTLPGKEREEDPGMNDQEKLRNERTADLHALIRNRSFLEAEELYTHHFCHGLIASSNYRDLCEDLLPFWHTGEPLPGESSANDPSRLPLLQLSEGITVTDAPVSHAFPGKAEKTVEQIIQEQQEESGPPEEAGQPDHAHPSESADQVNGRSAAHAKKAPARTKGKEKVKKKKKAKVPESSPPGDLKKWPAFRIVEMDQLEKRFRRKQFRPFRLRRYPSVALVSCEGMIVWGDEQPDSGRIGALSMRKIFQDLEESRNEAIFLYINSPGGLSDASEALYQDIYRLSRAKPVFAVIGPVAASGGYYMACAANRIYSPDLSLTGSVGVLRMRPELSGLYKKLGIKKERVRFGPTTDLLSEVGSLGKRSRALLDESMDRAYTLFLDRVGRSRGLDRKSADARGRGKVYTGAMFRAEGMVDRKGGFIEALRDFKKEAGYAEDQAFDIQMYPVLRPGAADLLREGPSLMQQSTELLNGTNLFLADPRFADLSGAALLKELGRVFPWLLR